MRLSGAEKSATSNSASSQIVTQACLLFDLRFGSGITVGAVARKLGISREHIARLFKMELGYTPHHYLLRKRLLTACHLLKESRLSSKDICKCIGGMAPQHFIRLFKKEFKMTPAHSSAR